jgi:hypothetical protein
VPPHEAYRCVGVTGAGGMRNARLFACNLVLCGSSALIPRVFRVVATVRPLSRHHSVIALLRASGGGRGLAARHRSSLPISGDRAAYDPDDLIGALLSNGTQVGPARAFDISPRNDTPSGSGADDSLLAVDQIIEPVTPLRVEGLEGLTAVLA